MTKAQLTEPLVQRIVEAVLAVHPQAKALVCVGSMARGDATPWSDIDLWVIGDGIPASTLAVMDGRLLTLSSSTIKGVDDSFRDPATALQAVAAWRSAQVLHDPSHAADALMDRATAWNWSWIEEAVPSWAAHQAAGLGEEVLKLLAADAAGDALSARVQASLIALQLTSVVRLLRQQWYVSENDLWRQGDADWMTGMRAVMLDEPEPSTRSALQMWLSVADQVAGQGKGHHNEVIELIRGRVMERLQA